MTTNLLPERPTYIAIVLVLVFAMISAVCSAQFGGDCEYKQGTPSAWSPCLKALMPEKSVVGVYVNQVGDSCWTTNMSNFTYQYRQARTILYVVKDSTKTHCLRGPVPIFIEYRKCQ